MSIHTTVAQPLPIQERCYSEHILSRSTGRLTEAHACRCLQSMEPVLLVGETGTGKTTVCQMAALMRGQRLHILNCNQHTETSDFLGGFRPARYVFCSNF